MIYVLASQNSNILQYIATQKQRQRMPTLPPTQPNSPAKLKPLQFTNAASSLKNIKHNTKIKTNKKEKIKKKKKTTLKQKGKNETDQCPAPKRRRKSRAQFVVKLFDLLQSGQHAKIVSWYKDAFVIWNRQEFANKVLPTLFNHSNFSSFERQMNFYSFSKMAVDAELPSKRRMKKTDPSKFKHRLFTQHSTPEDVEKISRTTSPNQKVEVVETLRLTKARNAIMASKIAGKVDKRCRSNLVEIIVGIFLSAHFSLVVFSKITAFKQTQTGLLTA